MKKYIIILLILTVIGLGLAVQLFTQGQQLDQTVFLQTTESIRTLQAQDKNLSLLLNESRYNSQFDHSRLSDTNYEVSEEFDNLRYDALFEEIEASQGLSDEITGFEEHFISREEELDIYIDSNTYITNSLVTINEVTQPLLDTDFLDQSAQVHSLIGKINATVYQLTLSDVVESKAASLLSDELLSQLSALISQANSEESNVAISQSQLLKDYESAIRDLVDHRDVSIEQFLMLEGLNTADLIDQIETEYTLSHNQAISGSNQFRNALIVYGLCLLAALLFFAYQIRKNYLSLEKQVADRTQEIQKTYEDLQESQEQLIQSEKMASLGQMVAGVAHEINTPLGYVTSNVDTLALNLIDLGKVVDDLTTLNSAVENTERNKTDITQKLIKTLKMYKELEAPDLIKECAQLLGDGHYGLTEISKLVIGLKDFSRLDRQATEQVAINECIDSSLLIASNVISENNVTVKKTYDSTPKIECFPSKLNQLFLNIITNACQAMNGKNGALTVTTAMESDNIVISFADEGTGMDEETQKQMFDPFFTSKEVGQGTGLGMSIAYKIIEAHHGSIDVSSELGKGTVITIKLPVTKVSDK